MQTRIKLLDALRDRLDAYAWETFSPTIFVGQTIFDPDVYPLPIVTIVPGVETAEPARYGTYQTDMPCDVSALVSLKDGLAVSEMCEPIFAELKKAILGSGEIEVVSGDEPQFVSITYAGGGIVDYPSDTGPAIVTIVVQCRMKFDQYIK